MSERLFHVAAAPFEAARRVAILPEGHRARRLHGHGFVARVRAEIPDGWAPFRGGEGDRLTQALGDCIAELDYRDLNEVLPIPTDENLARWVRQRLAVPGLDSVGIQSTPHQGADLDGRDHVHVWRRFRFEAAHHLPRVAADHPCGRLHGHGFEVILHADQDLAGHDMGPDFDRLEALWVPLHEALHQRYLNEIPGLENPTSEMLARWLWDRVRPELPALSCVSVYETATAGCHFDGRHFRIWKEQRFESAVRRVHAPADDPRHGWHGHSYLLRLHLTAPLDEVHGWTIDYGDVKALFAPIYRQLDHHPLNDLPHLDEAAPGHLVSWLREACAAALPQLDRIDLYETPGCGALLCWGDLGPNLPL
ncbi:6-carboxytetrahydropterin synthase [Thioalkalicoccus limnaeus]|uniref:6-carboxy-5,6,7,8-tetrahydropterin synthase n=1 Tax=Thioalkalicoccus limnaeus TaxID=120681 RepID=A0ABV4BBW0_9GAMM